MNQTPHFLASMQPPTRIAIDGKLYAVVPLPALVDFAHQHAGTITYPPPGGPGWATATVGGRRVAAWFEGAGA